MTATARPSLPTYSASESVHFLGRLFALGMLTVLCIDDDRENSCCAKRFLRAELFRVLTANTGADGIARANEHRCDAGVLDYSIPDMNGEEVARRRSQTYRLSFALVMHSLC